MANPVEQWKAARHGFDVWPQIEQHAAAGTPLKAIDPADLERMKWYGYFYRKRDAPGRYMNRCRVTAAELTAAQAKELARLAYEFGHGIVDVTTRANVQIQGLDIRCVPQFTRRLEAAGLTSKQTGHDNIRNVFGHPYSGLLADELFDTRRLCRDVTDVFLHRREYADLPRKMNICVSGAAEHAGHYWTQDISFLAVRTAERGIGFQLLVGGTQGQHPRLAEYLPVLVRAEQVVDVTRALLDLFRQRGSREKRDAARFRYLVESLGVAGVCEELAGRLPYALEPGPPPPRPARVYESLIGWIPQVDAQRWIMGLSVPLGRLTWQQLEGLGVLAERWGDGQLRTTHEQGMAVVNIPTAHKDAAATDAAALGLSVHADSLDRHTMACTGSQFCNIAVTQTKGLMFQLMEKLRQKRVRLEGIRIHMSGCPSSCAQHFTADIGLKGVRVRRLLGTREGFDVFLAGGLSDRVEMGRPFRLGVDTDQLPALVEEVVAQYYREHRPGQTFSEYWREQLPQLEASKAADDEYRLPVWICEACQHRITGTDPPVFCPHCAGLRRNFARLDEGAHDTGGAASAAGSVPGATASGAMGGGAASGPAGADGSRPEPATTSADGVRDDGFVVVAEAADVQERAPLAVEVAGREIALFRIGERIEAVDALCPHEGAPLVQGDVEDGVITCPWHGWTFNACTGCSLQPPGRDLTHYETRVEEGRVLVRVTDGAVDVGSATSAASATSAISAASAAAPASLQVAASAAQPRSTSLDAATARSTAVRTSAARSAPAAAEAELLLVATFDEAPGVRTFRFQHTGHNEPSRGTDAVTRPLPLDYPGRFARIAVHVDGQQVWRSFTVSSTPSRPETLDLTIKCQPSGVVSRYLFEHAWPGDRFTLRGPYGGFYWDPARHRERLVLVSAGSGATPMISMARFLRDRQPEQPCTFVHGARSRHDILFHDECRRLSEELPDFDYHVALSRPDDEWPGLRGRLDTAMLVDLVSEPAACRWFLCGPGDFMERLVDGLREAGVAAQQIHTEAFGTAALASTT